MDRKNLIQLLEKHNIPLSSIKTDNTIGIDNLIPSLLKKRIIPAEGFFKELARQLNLPFVSPEEIKKSTPMAGLLPHSIVKNNLLFPIDLNENKLKIATANPFDRQAIQTIKNLLKIENIEICVAPAQAIINAAEECYSEIHKQRAMADLFFRRPEESAYKVITSSQRIFLIGLALIFSLLFFINYPLSFIILFSVINLLYFIVNPVKFYISLLGFQGSRRTIRISKNDFQNLKEEDLPIYTILVPIFREAAVLPHILENINSFDYPKNKLDVKILMEENDTETIQAARKLGLFGPSETLNIFDPVIVPDGKIKTKPRACNYGLFRAVGEYCVIYDAEDDPEKDQLKKAVIAFRKIGPDYVCLQCRLNYYNPKQNLLTRWFALEYSFWFDYYLEGLDRVRAPLPLGGTSNHFRVEKLKKLGSWDPYNVTEDADLGVRISARKMKTAMLNSYTFEEANSRLGNWIRQRSRWFKGYIQTYLVHMRHPIKLLKTLGLKEFLYFQLTFGGNILLPLVNPILWVVAIFSIFVPSIFDFLFFSPIIQICWINLIIGNLVYIFLHLGTYILKKNYSLIPVALLLPFYWALISIGAWKGALQLITRPFYWEKTIHGLSKVHAAK